jgi:hypothetical protein
MAPEPARPAFTLSAAFDNHSRALCVGRGVGVGGKRSRDRQGLDEIQVWRTQWEGRASLRRELDI